MKEAECGHRGFSVHASKHITRRLLDMGQPGIGQKMARVCHNDLTRATEGRAKMSFYCQNFTRIKPFGFNNGGAGHEWGWAKLSFHSHNLVRIRCLPRKTVEPVVIVVHSPLTSHTYLTPAKRSDILQRKTR